MIARRACELFHEYLTSQGEQAKTIGQVTKSDMLGFADWSRKELSEQTVYAYWRSIKRCIAMASDWCPDLKTNAGQARWRMHGRSVPTVMDAGDVAILLDAIQLQWLNNMVYLCLMTGLRLGEVCHLQWSDIDLGRRMARIRSTKTGEDTIPLADDAIVLLRSIPQKSSFVFPQSTSDKPRSEWYVSHLFKRQVRRTALDGRVHFHTLRHTFATLLLRSGVGIYEVSKLMRHRSVTTTQIYLHILSSELHESVNRLKIDRPVRGARLTGGQAESDGILGRF